jgi:uncharacterized membrane-anchored protein
MNARFGALALLALVLVFPASTSLGALADGIKWQEGPSEAHMRDRADLKLPDGYIFADGKDTRQLMEKMQNPTNGSEVGFVAPKSMKWYAVFEVADVGYVKDDDKNKLDATAMLDSIRKGTEASNAERRKRGWAEMTIVGWQQAPRYNEATHNLEWAIKGESNGSQVINYNTRMLGRDGYMRVTLVCGPDELPATLPEFKQVLGGFQFSKGHSYAEFRKGDKMAKYGLTALVVGGGAAVAAKSGLFKFLGKGIIVIIAAIGAFLKKLFGRRSEA